MATATRADPATTRPVGDIPALVLAGAGAMVAAAGKARALSPGEALGELSRTPHLVCHAGLVHSRLRLAAGAAASVDTSVRHFDVCELFAFVLPARMATPTPHGIAAATGIESDNDHDPGLLARIASRLLDIAARPDYPHRREAATLADTLAGARWPWADRLLAALGTPPRAADTLAHGFNVWDRLDEWSEAGPRPPASQHPVPAEDACKLLSRILGPDAEQRTAQLRYCAAVAAAFQPRNERANHIVLAEAGTGLGKTLAYLAPASLWAKRNGAAVWVSTYTKNLQRQLDQEAARLEPDAARRRASVVIRKGRENYLCLLNLQEAIGGGLRSSGPGASVLAALIVRWARYSRDGDMVGGDFPSWLLTLEPGQDGPPRSPMSLALTDRRGECIYAACAHYRKCFIEKAARASEQADLVIANHALVLHRMAVEAMLAAPASEDGDEPQMPIRRIVFDEGHHLSDAADSTFATHLTGIEMAQLRRWLRGGETRGRRGRSLPERIGDLIGDDDDGEMALAETLEAASALAAPGWLARLKGESPAGPAEAFLAAVRAQVLARADDRFAGHHGLETDCRPLGPGIVEAGRELADALHALMLAMRSLAVFLARRLDRDAGELTSGEKARIEALALSLRRRSDVMVPAWIDVLRRLEEDEDARFVDWFAITRQFGREFDCGLYSHWVDPSEPLAEVVLSRLDGAVITSATLRDRPPEAPGDWRHAETRTGVAHLPWPVTREAFDSPFDYPRLTRVIVVNDVNRNDMDQVAAAYRELFIAAGGSAIGLFTAIARLRAVHTRLLDPLARAGLALYAQHVDAMDTATLIDMFRADKRACLLGSDAVRDGVDVPGQALRLMVLDRVPWGQPTILERARRAAFGGQQWQDMMVRLRLRQAYGRLIRRKDDHGVFVVLDSRLASRFASAFPDGVEIARMGLVDAIEETARFLTVG